MECAELFCGIGGFRLGIESNWQQQANAEINTNRDSIPCKSQQPNESTKWRNDINTVWANDFDKYACAIYRYHFGKIHEADISTVGASDVPDCDLITFGFPCQDISIAGKRAGLAEGTRSNLLVEAMRIIRAKKPKYFIAENVPGLFSVNEGYDFYKAIGMFTDSGYDVQWQVLNTRWFLPQNRERIYFVGHLRTIRRPEIFPIGEASRVNEGVEITRESVIGCLRARGEEDMHSGLNLISSNSQIRRLTPIECERLQGFPDNWTKYGKFKDDTIKEISDTQRYKCLGNAVSVPVVSAVVSRLSI